MHFDSKRFREHEKIDKRMRKIRTQCAMTFRLTLFIIIVWIQLNLEWWLS